MATQVANIETSVQAVEPATESTYDQRAFGDFGWAFVNAGEQYRKLKKVSKEDALMMCGIFKQATMGNCEVEEPKRGEQEIKQREEWLKHKGMDVIEAMQLYIDKVKELSQIYETCQDEETSDQAKQSNEK